MRFKCELRWSWTFHSIDNGKSGQHVLLAYLGPVKDQGRFAAFAIALGPLYFIIGVKR